MRRGFVPACLWCLAACGGEYYGPVATGTPEPTQSQQTAPARSDEGAPPLTDGPAALSTPEEDAVRDPRRFAHRSLEALAAEVEELDGENTAMLASSASKPGLLRKFAETLVEFERTASAAMAGLADDAQRRELAGMIATARGKATECYQQLVGYRDYPERDEALYFLALAYERVGDLVGARRSLWDLLTNHPQSPYVGHAYFAFGVYVRAEAKTDPAKWEVAQQKFREAASASTGLIQELARAQLGKTAEPQPSAPTPPAPAAPEPQAAPDAPVLPPGSLPALGDPGFVAAAPQPASYAVVIGIERYRDLPSAAGARGDAQKMAVLLGKTLGLREDHVHTAFDERATRTDIMKHIEWLKASVGPGGRAYLYFSGHGAPDAASGTPYVLPYDGDPKLVSTTAIELADVVRALGASRARDALVILDSCFSGAGGRSQLAAGTRPLTRVKEPAPPAQVAILSASAAAEISGIAPGGQEGLFTKYLADALGRGLADVDGDGQVSLHEVLEWVRPRVSREAKRDHRDQNPTVFLGAGARAAQDFIVGYGYGPR